MGRRHHCNRTDLAQSLRPNRTHLGIQFSYEDDFEIEDICIGRDVIVRIDCTTMSSELSGFTKASV